jgi:hypothetical protein
LWEITQRNLLGEATEYLNTAESHFAGGAYRTSQNYFRRALIIFSQLEDKEMIDSVTEQITVLNNIIFKLNVKMGSIALAVWDTGLCVFLVYSWVTQKRWSRLTEGMLLLSIPGFLGLLRVYYAHEEYAIIFIRYFVPLLVLSSAILLRKNIIGFFRTISALLSGHKDMLVLSITQSDGQYRVSVESIEEKFRPVKESRQIVFPSETKKDITKKVDFMMGVLAKYSSADVEKSLRFVEDILRETGETIYKNFIPEDFSDILKAKFLLLEVEDTEIPWELMYSHGFFASKYGISRRIVSTEAVEVQERRTRGRKALIISDPTEDLSDARSECDIVYRRLNRKMDTILVEGSTANMQKIAHLFGQGFDIIHFAGHVDTGLVLSDGDMTPQEVREFIVGTPIVFINGCTSEDIARAFLLGGAMAYVGTLHPVLDTSAADIATDFYNLCLQYQIGEALRRTRESHMGKDIVWASLIMYGDPTLKLL